MDIESLTKTERSILLYCETRLVDGGGLLQPARMNAEDHEALNKFKAAGILDWGRIPFRTMEQLTHPEDHPHMPGLRLSYWVTFHDEAWEMTHKLRRKRADFSNSPNRRKVEAALRERAAS